MKLKLSSIEFLSSDEVITVEAITDCNIKYGTRFFERMMAKTAQGRTVKTRFTKLFDPLELLSGI